MQRRKSLPFYSLLYAVAVGLVIVFPAGHAFPQSDFYKGKTIRIIRGGGPGGSGEFQTRALMRVLEKHIPGKPTLLLEFVQGAAGRKAANLIYSSTRPDGFTIGSIGAGLVVGPILGLPGSNYDLTSLFTSDRPTPATPTSSTPRVSWDWTTLRSFGLRAASGSAPTRWAIRFTSPRASPRIFSI